jgi:hypothetical protein
VSTCHFINFIFCQLAILSTCHFVNLPIYQLTNFSTCHYINFPRCQLAILLNCHFSSLPFSEFAILSTCHFFHFLNFVNLPFCQLSFCQLASSSTKWQIEKMVSWRNGRLKGQHIDKVANIQIGNLQELLSGRNGVGPGR